MAATRRPFFRGEKYLSIIRLLAHAGGTALADLGLLGLLVVNTLRQNLSVLVLWRC